MAIFTLAAPRTSDLTEFLRDAVVCSLVDADTFRRGLQFHHLEVNSPETSVSSHRTTQCNIPEGVHLRGRHHEDMKFHSKIFRVEVANMSQYMKDVQRRMTGFKGLITS